VIYWQTFNRQYHTFLLSGRNLFHPIILCSMNLKFYLSLGSREICQGSLWYLPPPHWSAESSLQYCARRRGVRKFDVWLDTQDIAAKCCSMIHRDNESRATPNFLNKLASYFMIFHIVLRLSVRLISVVYKYSTWMKLWYAKYESPLLQTIKKK